MKSINYQSVDFILGPLPTARRFNKFGGKCGLPNG